MNSSSAGDISTVELAYWKSGELVNFRKHVECQSASFMDLAAVLLWLSVMFRSAPLNIVDHMAG